LAGDSVILGVSVRGVNEGLMAGGVTVASNGNVTYGEYVHSTTPSVTINVTSGSLSLNGDGLLSGSINTDVGATSTILYGKLNSSKSFASFVSSTNFGEYDLVTVIKTGGSFVQADFQGTWHVCEISSGGSVENVYYGPVTVGSGGSFSTTRVNGSITVNSTGEFTGSGTLIPSGTVNLSGIMDTTKELATYINVYSTGELSLAVAIKETGSSFSLVDLSGTWHFTLASTGNISEGVSYGTIQLDAAGQVRGGYYRTTSGNVSLTGGAVSISSLGVISGSINAADGSTLSIVYGKMNNSKNTITMAGSSTTGAIDLVIAQKL